jgi:branched-chain amino acid transport system ATP-binding protein
MSRAVGAAGAGDPAPDTAAHMVDVRGLSKRYAGVQALDDVTLRIPAGARHAIIGPNGAGKSTLFKCISGEVTPTQGTVALLGREVTGMRPDRIARLGVSRTFQHSARFEEESLLANCLVSAHATAGGRGLSLRRMGTQRDLREAAEEALRAVGLADRRGEPASGLSHGEARQLEIAMALAQRPTILLADEPLAGLSEAERAQVGALLHGLSRDLTLVFVEHDLAFVLGLADRITVLNLGQHLTTGSPEEVQADPEVTRVYIGVSADAPPRESRAAATTRALEVEGVAAGYGSAEVLHDVTIAVPQGRVLGVLGKNGMGKTTLLNTLMGLVPARAGSIRLAGEELAAGGPLERARAGLALVPQGRGILHGLNVEEQLTLGMRDGHWTLERVYDLFKVLGDRRKQIGTTLSGGEQQMLAIGRALLRNPRVLLMDEPSEGLAPLIVDQVRDTVAMLADAGETIVLAEQNVTMALAVADDVVVLERGRVVHRATADALRADDDLQKELLGL